MNQWKALGCIKSIIFDDVMGDYSFLQFTWGSGSRWKAFAFVQHPLCFCATPSRLFTPLILCVYTFSPRRKHLSLEFYQFCRSLWVFLVCDQQNHLSWSRSIVTNHRYLCKFSSKWDQIRGIKLACLRAAHNLLYSAIVYNRKRLLCLTDDFYIKMKRMIKSMPIS